LIIQENPRAGIAGKQALTLPYPLNTRKHARARARGFSTKALFASADEQVANHSSLRGEAFWGMGTG
jgi:hypothetical protein